MSTSITTVGVLAEKLLDQLVEKGFFSRNFYNEDDYELFRSQLVKTNFHVPQTSITRVVSRLLFGLGINHLPKNMVGAGIYTGHALSWLSAFSFFDREKSSIYGLDISSDAIDYASNNFKRLGMTNVHCIKENALDWINKFEQPIDLLFIDIDTNEKGKAEYTDLLEIAYPRLSEGALVVAHDINENKFSKDLQPYIQLTSDKTRFSHNINLDVDAYGLGIAKKKFIRRFEV
jgi:predicted O-methyltransferase YrrM